MNDVRPHGWMVSPYSDDGSGRASLVLWKAFREPRLACSSAIVGGGLREVNWVINATVAVDYRLPDPVSHARSIAQEVHLEGEGACLLTAVDVSVNARWRSEDGVMAMATAGISQMGWAAMPVDADVDAPRPGTINIVVELPVAMSHGALVNMVMTATEAKAQYFAETRRRGTGTPTDAVVVLCPRGPVLADGLYGGPRSRWGSVAARAVLAALHARDREIDR